MIAKAAGSVTITLHFKNYAGWPRVATKATEGGSWTSISGYEKYNDWPGPELTEEADHSGYYTLTVTKNTDSQFNCIFNDAEDGSGNQTANIVINANDLDGKTKIEGWVINASGEIKYDAPASWTSPGASDAEYLSPEVSGTSVTFRYKDSSGSAEQVRVAGNMTDWQAGAVDMNDDDHDNIWVCTMTLVAGTYEYKFIVGDNDWKADPVNNKTSNGNSLLVVPGLASGDALTATKGTAISLPATLNLYDEAGESTSAAVTYEVKDPADAGNVTISGGKLTVNAGYAKDKLVLTASDGNGHTADVTVDVVSKLYTYTIYYYDFEEEHQSDSASALWLWSEGVNGKEYPDGSENSSAATESISTTIDGESVSLEWVKWTVKVPYTELNMIPKNKSASPASPTWSWQKPQVNFSNAAKADACTFYLVAGDTDAHTSLPDLSTPRERYAVVEYSRSASDYTNWNIYSWNTGMADEVTVDGTVANGVDTFKIRVVDSKVDHNLAFCMRRSVADEAWAEKDGGNHYIMFPGDQTVVKAKFIQNQGITQLLPYNTGYEMDGDHQKIHFYYRDDALFLEGQESTLTGKVSVNINGTEYPMAYDSANERYYYTLSENVATGDYYYYYVINDGLNPATELTDAFNPTEPATHNGKTCSKITYKHFDNLSVAATMHNAAMDADDNNVVKIEFAGADKNSITKEEVKSIEVDQTALGIGTLNVHPELMEGTIACLNTVAPGSKTLPVKVTDIYGNTYTTSVSVTVTANTKTENDFDWDEAVIYFAVTDRFFDGDTSNNDAYGEGDYNKGEKGGSSYHGGDFAGLTQKLDYLKELGVNTIWITPIVENITEDQHNDELDFATYGYHGYWASDFTKLNKHLGTEAQFKALLDAAHAKNMKIMVDIVINHAGYGTEEYFNGIIPGTAMLRTSANSVAGSDIYSSLSGLPDFVTEDPAVRAQLVKWQTDWMTKYAIDYYRVDTVKHVDSTTWAAFKNSLTKENADFKLIGEYYDAGYASNGGELGTGTMDALLDFDMNDWAEEFVTGNIASVENSLVSRNSVINNTAAFGSFLSSHDEDSLQHKLVTEKGLTEQQAYTMAKVAATLQITAKGMPVIYYGEEIGQAGANNWPYQTNRRDFDWAELAAQKAQSNSMYSHYKKLLGIRNEYTDVFARGTRSTVKMSDAEGYDVFSRSYQGTTLYVGMNIKGAAKTVSLSMDANGIYKDLYSGKSYTASAAGALSVPIPAAAAGGTIVLVKTGTATAAPDTTTGSDNSGNSSNSGSSNTSMTIDQTTGAVTTTTTTVDKDGNKTESVTTTEKDGTVTNTTIQENKDGTTVESESVAKPDGSKKESVVEKAADGTVVKTTDTVTKADGSATEKVKESDTNSKGNDMTVTTTTRTDASGEVTSVVQKTEIPQSTATTSTTVTVKKDGDDKITSATASVTNTVADGNKATITTAVTSQITEAAGTKNVDITMTVKDEAGNTKYKVQVNTKDLTKGNELYVYRKDTRTGKYNMVNANTYGVNDKGNVSVAMDQKGTYELVDKAEAKKINKEIKKSITPKKKTVNVNVGKKASFALSSKAQKGSVQSISYTTADKALVTVNKKGKITAKAKGTVTVTAKVTLKNGTTKKIKMTIKVK